MPVDFVIHDVGVRRATASNPRTCILTNVIVIDVGTGVVNQNSVSILDYFVLHDPRIAAFDRENTFGP